MNPSSYSQPTDALSGAHSEWQWRSAAVWAAYERWSADGGGFEFASYRVALDLEEAACRRYMELTRQA